MIVFAPRAQAGSALLLVAGASAAVAMLAMILLSAALSAYETAALRRDGIQARLLAASGLVRLADELAAGGVVIPRQVGSSTVWRGELPAPPVGSEPLRPAFAATLSLPPRGAASTLGDCGFRVTLRPVPGPAGAQRLSGTDGPGAVLVDAIAEGWCGRGYERLLARFALFDDGTIERLY